MQVQSNVVTYETDEESKGEEQAISLDRKLSTVNRFLLCVPSDQEFDEMITHATSLQKKKPKSLQKQKTLKGQKL